MIPPPGVFRVGKSRVLLELVLRAFKAGATPEAIVQSYDTLNLTDRPPKFAPELADLATPMINAFGEYVRRVSTGGYPTAEHGYEMPEPERMKLAEKLGKSALPAKSAAP